MFLKPCLCLLIVQSWSKELPQKTAICKTAISIELIKATKYVTSRVLNLWPMGQMLPAEPWHQSCGAFHRLGNLAAGEQWQLILSPSLLLNSQSWYDALELGHALFPSCGWVGTGPYPLLPAGLGYAPSLFMTYLGPGHTPFLPRGWVVPLPLCGARLSPLPLCGWIRAGLLPPPHQLPTQSDGAPLHLPWVPDWDYWLDPAHRWTGHCTSTAQVGRKFEHQCAT